jgi:hypothetical protein
MSTVITAGNISANFNMSGDGTGILEFRTGTGAGTTALTISAAQKAILACTALSTASNGMIEYNGTAFYGTPQGNRGLIPSAQYFRLNADLVGADSTSTQKVFGVGATLTGSTVYAFQGMYLLAKTTGTTAHTIGYNFGGTATLNNIGGIIDYQYATTNIGTPTLTAGNFARGGIVNTSLVTLGGAGSSSTQYHIAATQGTVSINAGGTFVPQFTLSAAPGGAYSTLAGSYFCIYPIGVSGSNTSIGTWA